MLSDVPFEGKVALAFMLLVVAALLVAVIWPRSSPGAVRPRRRKTKPEPDEYDGPTERLDEEKIRQALEVEPDLPISGIPCQRCQHANMPDAAFCEACRAALNPNMLRQQLEWREGRIELTVGRGRDADIFVHSPSNQVSRRQARVIFSGGTLSIEDWGTTVNGIWLRKIRLEKRTMLVPGDVVKFGGGETLTYDQIITCLADRIRTLSNPG